MEIILNAFDVKNVVPYILHLVKDETDNNLTSQYMNGEINHDGIINAVDTDPSLIHVKEQVIEYRNMYSKNVHILAIPKNISKFEIAMGELIHNGFGKDSVEISSKIRRLKEIYTLYMAERAILIRTIGAGSSMYIRTEDIFNFIYLDERAAGPTADNYLKLLNRIDLINKDIQAHVMADIERLNKVVGVNE